MQGASRIITRSASKLFCHKSVSNIFRSTTARLYQSSSAVCKNHQHSQINDSKSNPSTNSHGRPDSSYFDRINTSITRQGFSKTIGLDLVHATYGEVVIDLPFTQHISQQQGYFHGGVIGTLGDNTAGYAGLTVAEDDKEVMTVEYKMNFIQNFNSGRLRAYGKVIKGGKRLIVTSCEVFHIEEASEVGKEEKKTLCASMIQTLVPVPKKY